MAFLPFALALVSQACAAYNPKATIAKFYSAGNTVPEVKLYDENYVGNLGRPFTIDVKVEIRSVFTKDGKIESYKGNVPRPCLTAWVRYVTVPVTIWGAGGDTKKMKVVKEYMNAPLPFANWGYKFRGFTYTLVTNKDQYTVANPSVSVNDPNYGQNTIYIELVKAKSP